MTTLRLFLLLLIFACLVSCEGWRLEQSGRAKCERGLSLFFHYQRQQEREGLSRSDRMKLHAMLTEARDLLSEGLSIIGRVEKGTGKAIDTKRYSMAYFVADCTLVRPP